ncbi:MAG: ParA family protein [Methylacidiphilales bacterium]|nr:ParA family protein [Candidatus Methylacidiphilales bacterium]
MPGADRAALGWRSTAIAVRAAVLPGGGIRQPALGSLAIVPVLVDTRSTMQRAVLAELIRRYGPERIFRAIRVDVSLAEAFGQGVPVRAYRPASRGAADFERLCGEISSIGKTYSPSL